MEAHSGPRGFIGVMEDRAPSGGMRRTVTRVLAALSAILLMQLFLRFRASPLLFDEIGDFCRIESFLKGTWRTQDCGVATLPGYHLLIASGLSIWSAASVPSARSISFFLSLLSCIPVFLIARLLHRSQALVRTLGVVTLPILLPFFPLLYTDVLGLGMLLWSLWAALRRRPLLAALLLTAAICVRQNAILWLPLIAVVSLERTAISRFPSLGSLLGRGYAFFLPIAFFGLFLWYNGGVSLHRSAVTPAATFSLGNVFFALFLFTSLFLPLVLALMRQMTATLFRRRWVWLLLLVFCLLFIFGFSATHPINQQGGQLRDAILLAVTTQAVPRTVFLLAGVLALLMILVTPLQRPSFFLLYPIAFLSLSTLWMIETRYALVPLVLFMLLRKSLSWRMEIMQVAYNFVVLAWIFS